MIHVKITEKDIRSGQRAIPTLCPVAKGIRRALRTSKIIVVGEHTVSIGLSVVNIPGPVIEKIAQFDYQGQMEPFEFDLAYEVETCG